MNTNETRLVLSDLDQTLLHRDKSVSAYSVDVLRKVQQKGILVGVATARSEPSARELVPGFEPDVVISSGGAVARLHGKTVFSHTLPADDSAEILRSAANAPSVGKITAHVKEGVYWNVAEGENRPPGYAHHRYFDFHEPFVRDTYCMTIASKEEAWVTALAARYPDSEVISYTGEHLHRFARKGGNKVDALRACCAALDIGLEQVMAFGDDINDIEMLAACGMGVAVANAVPAVRAVAWRLLPLSNEEDGVARYLASEFLNK